MYGESNDCHVLAGTIKMVDTAHENKAQIKFSNLVRSGRRHPWLLSMGEVGPALAPMLFP